jgi:CRISPR system Cascade subunit CasC
MSKEFEKLLGGLRTRQLANEIARVAGRDVPKRAEKILDLCGFKEKKTKKDNTEEEENSNDQAGLSKMLVYTTKEAIKEMASLLSNPGQKTDEELAEQFAKLIAEKTAVPDMALSGRMLEPDKSSKVWKELNTTVEASLQVAHAISTHAAHTEVDYYVAKDDIPGEDAGAGFLDEAMFASACYYKYFSINWEQLLKNLEGFPGNVEHLAAHTVGAFLRAAACTTPSGKQNSNAAHNRPDGILVELRNSPVSYANAFAKPAEANEGKRDLISQSIAQLGQYIYDLDIGYGKPKARFWFSCNLRYPLTAQIKEEVNDKEKQKEIMLSENNLKSLDELVDAVIKVIGYDWNEVQKVAINSGAVS